MPAAAGCAARVSWSHGRDPLGERHVVTRRVRHPQRVRSRVASYERNDQIIIDGANVRVCQGRWGWACAMSQAQTQAQSQSVAVAVEVR